jgi:predicted Zn-dependent protease with MMP-like domain
MFDISAERFSDLVGEALDAIPPELLKLLDNVVIQVADGHPDDPSLLGLYEGTALTERDHSYVFTAPDQITIYRLPLLGMCTDEDEVADEVAITVVHELGHHFGIDDDRLHELGWA